MGDPAGVGPEIILKSARSVRTGPPLVIAGDLGALRAASALVPDAPQAVPWTPGDPLPSAAGRLPVIEVSRLKARALRAGKPTLEGADAAYRYIRTAAEMALAGSAAGIITAPINKEWLNRAGHHFAGHSELLAQMAGVRRWRMMFVGRQLRLALVTVHLGLAKVSRCLSEARVFDTIALLSEHLQHDARLSHPRVAVLGFNPHAGESGLFGREEIDAIQPAIARARSQGIDAFGPLPPDTAFVRSNGRFRFDAAVAMYHDQGLIPLKMLDFDHAVNVTLGLPFVRTSPDHGTAYDIAGQGSARAESMSAAIRFAARVARRRAATGMQA